MRSKSLLLSLLGVAVITAGLSAAGTQLAPGKYMSTLDPSVNETSADKIEKQLAQIKEIRAVDVKPDESALHFTVKDNAKVDWTRIANAVKTAVPGTAVSEPTTEPASSAATPGATGTAPAAPAASTSGSY